MTTISSRLQQQYPADDKGWGAVVVALRESWSERSVLH